VAEQVDGVQRAAGEVVEGEIAPQRRQHHAVGEPRSADVQRDAQRRPDNQGDGQSRRADKKSLVTSWIGHRCASHITAAALPDKTRVRIYGARVHLP
jgi:hypothetical protein